MFHAEVGHQRAGHAAFHATGCDAVARDDVDQLVAVENPPVAVGHHQAVAIAVKGNAEIGLVLFDCGGQGRGVSSAALGIDVEAIGLGADGDDFRAQFMQHVRRNMIGGAVGAIDDDAQAAQVLVEGETAFAEFDVARGGVIDAARPPQFAGGRGLHFGFHQGFDGFLDGIRQFLPGAGEELDAVVFVGIV